MSQEQTTGLIPCDFSDTRDKIEPGVYKVRIKESEFKPDVWTTKDGKKVNSILWTLETFEEKEDKNNGRYIFHGTDVNGPFASRLKEFYLAASGLELEGNIDPTSLYGVEVEVTVGQQKKKPEYTEVKAVRPITHS